LEEPYIRYSGKSFYDIAAPEDTPFPRNYMLGLLSQRWVQEALGVPLNFSDSIGSVFTAFHEIGDYARGGFLEDIAYILDSGIKVALVYGDRDYACNWIGGENVSLSIPYSGQRDFRLAGYADLNVNGAVAGKVRQHGNFSFTRVYQAGHEVPAYQPQAAYEIFNRAMNNFDIATGKSSTAQPKGAPNVYSSTGPPGTWDIKLQADPQPAQECYILAPQTCTDDQLESALNGTAVFKNYMWNGTKGKGKGGGGKNSASITGVNHLVGIAIFISSFFIFVL
jgi:hypothetical protein